MNIAIDTKDGAKLLKASGEIVLITPKDGKEFSLPEMQKYVGGYIEVLNPPGCPGSYMIVNEEGKFQQPPFAKNQLASDLWQAGCDPDSDRASDDVVGDVMLIQKGQIS